MAFFLCTHDFKGPFKSLRHVHAQEELRIDGERQGGKNGVVTAVWNLTKKGVATKEPVNEYESDKVDV